MAHSQINTSQVHINKHRNKERDLQGSVSRLRELSLIEPLPALKELLHDRAIRIYDLESGNICSARNHLIQTHVRESLQRARVNGKKWEVTHRRLRKKRSGQVCVCSHKISQDVMISSTVLSWDNHLEIEWKSVTQHYVWLFMQTMRSEWTNHTLNWQTTNWKQKPEELLRGDSETIWALCGPSGEKRWKACLRFSFY